MSGLAQAPTVTGADSLPGDPRDDNAGPSLPADVKTSMPQSCTALAKTSETRPESGSGEEHDAGFRERATHQGRTSAESERLLRKGTPRGSSARTHDTRVTLPGCQLGSP